MAESTAERLKRLKSEVGSAEEVYGEWAKQFKVDRLEDFVVKSLQRETRDKFGAATGGFEKDPYLVNLLLPSLGARLPALMFQIPHAIVTAREPLSDDQQPPAQAPQQIPPEMLAMMQASGMPVPATPPQMERQPTAAEMAQLREDLLNTTIQSDASGFKDASEEAIREAFFRFGMVEVKFTADYEDVKESSDPDEPTTAGPVEQPQADASDPDPEKIPKRLPKPGTERVIFERIPAKQVLISANSKTKIGKCDWIGYWEWKYVGDVKANPNYKNKSSIKEELISSAPGHVDKKVSKTEGYENMPAPAKGMVKVIKVWYIRDRKRYTWIEGAEDFLQDGKAFEFLTLAALCFEPILDQFLPVPVCYNWTGSQIAYNETRDSQRVHRRRALRKFLYLKGALTDEEAAKLSSAEDMQFAEVEAGNGSLQGAVIPVQMAPMDPIHREEADRTVSELMQITKAGSEQRQVASDATATAVNVAAINKQVQDSADRDRVAKFLEQLCLIALKLMEQNFTHAQVIKTTVDLGAPGAAVEAKKQTAVWRKIEMSNINPGDLDYEVSIDVESLSPPNSTIKAQQTQAMMQLMSNPNVLTLLSIPEFEPFARQFLQTQGFRSEDQVQSLFATARKFIEMQQAQAAAAAQSKMPPGAPTLPGGGPNPPGGDPMAALTALASQGGIPA